MSLSESEPEVLVSPFRYWKKLKPVATPKPILKRPSASMGGGQAKKQKVSAGDSDGSQSEDPFFFTLGTDASGFENGMRAALVANLSPQLVFTCEKDKKLRELIRVTYKPITSYVDMTTRNNHKAPTVQLFITSPNCQSYSTNGKLSGIEDDRGKHLIHTLDYVKVQQPKVMILEEVPGLATMLKFQKTWKHVLKSLKNTATRWTGSSSMPTITTCRSTGPGCIWLLSMAQRCVILFGRSQSRTTTAFQLRSSSNLHARRMSKQRHITPRPIRTVSQHVCRRFELPAIAQTRTTSSSTWMVPHRTGSGKWRNLHASPRPGAGREATM